MEIAITGSTGFIGSALMKYLSDKDSLTLLPFNKNKYSLASVESLKDFVKNKDVIIHLAGVTKTINNDDYYIINTLYTRNLLEAISLYGKKNVKFIFFSSFAVYEELTKPTLLDEDKTKTIPHNEYGISKLAAEKYIKAYHQEKNINAYIFRLANVYGPGMKQTTRSVIYNCIKNIQTNKPIVVNGTGKQTRDFIYIDDIIQAIAKSIYSQTHNFLIVNICSSIKIEIIKLIKDIEKILKKKAVIQFNKTNREKGYWIGNNKKAYKEINFKPKVNLETGLKKTIDWYLKNST